MQPRVFRMLMSRFASHASKDAMTNVMRSASTTTAIVPPPRCFLKHQSTPIQLKPSHCMSTMAGNLGATTTTTIEVNEDGPPAYMKRLKSNFCRICGSKMGLIKMPGQENEWRHVCSSSQCGYTDYFNPRMVVGCVVEHEGKVLLCRRAIEPCKGLWTVPAGFLELSESTAQGAARETREEACAEVDIQAPYCHWDIPVIGQAYILFRGNLAPPYTHAPGPESLETRLFAPQEIPFDQIAFSSVALSLKYFIEDMRTGHWRLHHGVIEKQPGAAPNDPSTFGIGQLLQLDLQ